MTERLSGTGGAALGEGQGMHQQGPSGATERTGTVMIEAPPVTEVALVFDRLAFAELLARAIDGQADLGCTIVTRTVDELLEPGAPRARVVMLDGDQGASEMARDVARIREAWPESHVIALVDFDDPQHGAPLVNAGAAAVLARRSGTDEILQAMRSVGAGIMVLSHAAISAARDRLRSAQRRSPAPFVRATERERDVLEQLSRGANANAIAASLGMSVNTCRGHIKRLMTKFGAHTQLELVLVARDAGLLPADSRR